MHIDSLSELFVEKKSCNEMRNIKLSFSEGLEYFETPLGRDLKH